MAMTPASPAIRETYVLVSSAIWTALVRSLSCRLFFTHRICG